MKKRRRREETGIKRIQKCWRIRFQTLAHKTAEYGKSFDGRMKNLNMTAFEMQRRERDRTYEETTSNVGILRKQV